MSDPLDILIVGGGVAGLSAAAAFAAAGRRVLVVDSAPGDAGAADTRTTAILRPGVDLLNEAGVWPRLESEIAPLRTMRLIDAGGRENTAREVADFDADEVMRCEESPVFGWNVPNAALRAALAARLEDFADAAHLTETRVEGLTVRRDVVIARLSTGDAVKARLVIGADGRNSAVRDFAGIGARRWSYGQKALVFTVAHDQPHLGVSTEIHRTGGPFTLVPMPDGPDGRPRSSVVWMEKAGEADRLAALAHDDFEAALNERSVNALGRLDLASRRAAWPIMSLLADRLTAPRVALIAEAAHVVPPIGAQGLNMSLGDLAALQAAIGPDDQQMDPGRIESLDRYRLRWPEIAVRVAGVDALNRAALAEAQPLRDLRRFGLGVLSRVQPMRRAAMRLGLGVRG